MPIVAKSRVGSLYKDEAIMAPALRTSFTTKVGRALVRAAPATSVTTATAPRATAAAMKFAPCTFVPGIAKKISPASTSESECTTPVISIPAANFLIASVFSALTSCATSDRLREKFVSGRIIGFSSQSVSRELVPALI